MEIRENHDTPYNYYRKMQAEKNVNRDSKIKKVQQVLKNHFVSRRGE